MSVKLIKFPTAPGEEAVSAVKVTAKNLMSIHNWLLEYLPEDAVVSKVYIGKDGAESKHRVSFKTPKGPRVAKVGDWVIRHTKTPARGGKKGIYYFTVGKDDDKKINVKTAIIEKSAL